MMVAMDHCTASCMVGSQHILCSANFFPFFQCFTGHEADLNSYFFIFHGMSNLSLSVNLICYSNL